MCQLIERFCRLARSVVVLVADCVDDDDDFEGDGIVVALSVAVADGMSWCGCCRL